MPDDLAWFSEAVRRVLNVGVTSRDLAIKLAAAARQFRGPLLVPLSLPVPKKLRAHKPEDWRYAECVACEYLLAWRHPHRIVAHALPVAVARYRSRALVRR